MILNIGSMIAVFVDTVTQAPIQFQCVQPPATESWTKWLLQFVLSIIPVAGGVGIALWSFHATSKRDHERWILDHKMAEWRELLMGAAEIQRVLRMESMPLGERAREIADKLKHAVHELSVASASCVFLQDFFADAEKRAKFYSFLYDADGASESIGGLIELYRQRDLDLTQEERSRTVEDIMQKTHRITSQYLAFCEWLRKEAAISLGTTNNARGNT